MSLHNFWVIDGRPINIGYYGVCGYIVSTDDSAVFQGRSYNALVQRLSGVSLYTERIKNESVRVIADALESNQWRPEFEARFYVTEREYQELTRMFRDYANAGAELHGDW